MTAYFVILALFLFGDAAAALIIMAVHPDGAVKIAKGIRCVFCLAMLFWTIALAVKP